MASTEGDPAPAIAPEDGGMAASDGAALRAVADPSAAVLRVAGLVAHGAATPEVFDAIGHEVSALLGGAPVAVLPVDGAGAVVATTRTSTAPAGHRLRGPAGPMRGDAAAWTAVVPVTVGGRIRAVLATDCSTRPAAEVEACLDRFAELAAAALSRAEERAQLTGSRARVLAGADESRRRLQRDLHDGPQQRVVHALIALKLARATVEVGSATALLVEEALTNVEQAGRELRDLVDGILPRSLTHGGLRTGLESLVADLPLPVTVHVTGCRPPPAIEVTAFLLVAEALRNAVEHSRAETVTVAVEDDGDTVVVEVRDDGVGGADPTRGSGLTSVQDRVDIAAGSLTITSPPGQGTVVRARLPLPAGSTPGAARHRGEL